MFGEQYGRYDDEHEDNERTDRDGDGHDGYPRLGALTRYIHGGRHRLGRSTVRYRRLLTVKKYG